MKDSKESFYRNIHNKRQTGEIAGPLQKEMRDLAAWAMEKAEVSNAFFVSVFTNEGE